MTGTAALHAALADPACFSLEKVVPLPCFPKSRLALHLFARRHPHSAASAASAASASARRRTRVGSGVRDRAKRSSR